MNIEAELLIIHTNLEDLYRRVEAENTRHRDTLSDIQDEILQLMDKRAVVQAASQGIEVGTVMVAKRPLLWQGKMQDGLRIKVARISSGFESQLWHASGYVAIKGGWSKREIYFDPRECEIESS